MVNNNPWLGLNTYAEHDRLYGRDKETDEISDIILNNLSTVIYGRSGVGKSSLLRAGVFPRMRYEDFLPVYIRLEHNTAEGYFQQVSRKIKEASADADILMMTADGDMVLKERQSSIRKYPMLVFDQFEEIFTLPDNAHRPAVAEFFSHLASLLNNSGDSGNAFRVVICLREDYLYFLEQNSSDIPSLKRNRYRLMPLSLSEGREVICRPLPGAVTAETADVILERIDTDRSGYVDPSILSLFMHELYEKGSGSITLENIRLYGDNIITDFYEDGMRSVSVKTAKFLEDRLVTTDGYRHYLSYNDALAAGVMAGELDTLKEKRIITVEKGEKNQRIIELSHDVLCPLVLQSRKERKLKEEADRLAAKTKAMRRRNRVMLLSLSAALLLVAVFVYLLVEIRQQRNGMLISQSRFVAKEAMEVLHENEDYVKALALLTETFPKKLKKYAEALTVDAFLALQEVMDSIENTNMRKIIRGPVGYGKFSPDGELLWIHNMIYDTKTWGRIATIKKAEKIQGKGIITDASFSADSRYLVVGFSTGEVVIYNPKSGLPLSVLQGGSGRISKVEYSSNGSYVGANCVDKCMVWDMKTQSKVLELSDASVLFTPAEDNVLIETMRADSMMLILQNIKTNDKRIIMNTSEVCNIYAYSLDRKYCICVLKDGDVAVWNLEKGKQQSVLKCLEKDAVFAEFSPDSKKIVTGGGELWNTENGKLLVRLEGVRNGKTIFQNREVRIGAVVNAVTGDPLTNLDNFDSHVSFSPDGTKIVNGTAVWDVETGKLLTVFRGWENYGYITTVALTPDSKYVLTGGFADIAVLWEIDKMYKCNLVDNYSMQKSIVSVCKSGQYAIKCSDKKNVVELWDIRNDNKLTEVYCRDNNRNDFILSPDASIIVEIGASEVFIYNVEEGAEDIISQIHTTSVSFSENSKLLALGLSNGEVMIRNVETGTELRMSGGHIRRVTDVSFNFDGSCLITASIDSTAIIWNVNTGKQLSVFENRGIVVSAFFTPNGEYALIQSDLKSANIYDTTSFIECWDVDNGERQILLTSDGDISLVSENSISYDSEYIVIAYGKHINIFNINKKNKCFDIENDIGYALTSFSPDGKYIAAISDGDRANSMERTIEVWDIENNECYFRSKLPKGAYQSIFFSHDSKCVFILSNNRYGKSNCVIVKNIPDPEKLIKGALDVLNDYRLSPEDRRRYYLD